MRMNKLGYLSRSEIESVLITMVNNTANGRQEWKLIEYLPITVVRVTEGEADISQSIMADTTLYGSALTLELTETIHLPEDKGDVSGQISYMEKCGKQVFSFALSYEWKNYRNCNKEELQKCFCDSAIVKLDEQVVPLLLGSGQTLCNGENDGIFYKDDTEAIWCNNPVVRMGRVLMRENRLLDFHNSILDWKYRKALLDEMEGRHG